jgi:hypothetical protein
MGGPRATRSRGGRARAGGRATAGPAGAEQHWQAPGQGQAEDSVSLTRHWKDRHGPVRVTVTVN